jgi:hypothetical protein
MEIPLGEIALERAIILDWHDGPLEGFLRLFGIDYTWYFQIVGERTTSDGPDDRLYILFEAAADSLDRLSEVLAEDEATVGELWVPSWDFRDTDAQQRAEAVLATLLGLVGRAEVFLRSSNLLKIEGVWSTAGRTRIIR